MRFDELVAFIDGACKYCADDDHRICDNSGACEGARVILLGDSNRFDAGRIELDHRDDWPDPSWPTTALLRLVKDNADGITHSSSLYRSMRLTEALAELAMRGLSPDAVLRTWLGPRIVQRVLDSIVFCCMQKSNDEGDVNSFQSWAARFLEELTDDERRNAGIPELMVRINDSEVCHAVRRWCGSASVTDLVGFRIQGYREAEVLDEDLVVPAGEGATIWLCERLAVTHLESWSGTSLVWELAYLHDPEEIIEVAEVLPGVIRERAVPLVAVMKEIARRLRVFGVVDSAIDGLSNKQMTESVVSLLKDGAVGDAVDLARRAVRRSPGDPELALVLACSLMSTEPEDARLILTNMLPASILQVLIDLATLEMADGNIMDSLRYLESVDIDDVDGWYWDPLDYCEHRMRFRYFTGNEWNERAARVLEGVVNRMADS